MTGWQQSPATALLILADGTRLEGRGIGAIGHSAGEVCFNTTMTGYQEVLTDPSYAGQIVTFTFPHIGNVGTNDEDIETVNMAALSRRAWRRAQGRYHQPLQLPRHRAARRLAQEAQHHRHHRHRHPRPDRPDPRAWHAQRRHRPFRATVISTKSRCWPSSMPSRVLSVSTSPRKSPPPRPITGTRPAGNGTRATAPRKSRIPHRRHRLRRQAQYPALPRR